MKPCASAWRRVGRDAGSERLVAELQFELWIGDAAVIRAKRGRKQKTDRQDAQHILQLMLKDDFPKIWVPSWENRDLRQLLWHRHRMVQARTRVMNQLQAVALNEGLRCKKKLWRERGRQQLESFALAPWASRRHDLLELYLANFPEARLWTAREVLTGYWVASTLLTYRVLIRFGQRCAVLRELSLGRFLPIREKAESLVQMCE